MKHSPLAILAIVLLGTLTGAQHTSEPVPWVEVDRTGTNPWSNIDWIDLVALGEDSFVACYQCSGGRFGFGGIHVVRSTDAGRSWTRIQSFADVHSSTLAWDGSTAWLIAMSGEDPESGIPIVLRATDASVSSFREPRRIRGSEWLRPVETSIVHEGRVWRAFRRNLITTCHAMREQVVVASARLGDDLQDPSSWRWSGELPSDCIGAAGYGSPMRFVGGGESPLRLMIERDHKAPPSGMLELENDGWTLREAREIPPWKATPRAASRFQRLGDGSFHAVEPHGAHLLTLLRSPDMETWQQLVLLSDVREEPLHFFGSAVRIHREDLLVLFAYRTSVERDLHAGIKTPSYLAFLRVPKHADRTTSDPPLWLSSSPR